ncbi:TetR/AcrR family transcriptional regulator [Dethiobacter alkaliphilus]|uniref:Transcriptional regulator, TetR family n=1 Tax=Dethiobacter alkaliphilus AHT 1 TaxID=555088 RepID=C0GCG6_DETAL|nr:TetR/AcrR family transcriptional regulator [Dethiobacter alkaliphilus]EEG78901.1 transcriptional regulator, TetR family [Dethiobacter alkaliphilus AHT 1]
MSPKTKFSKEEIVHAAFEIAKEEGFSGITARSVAKRLGCSVAPIYVNFANIDDLTAAVVERVFALSNELTAAQDGEDMFAKIGKASLEFARQYPVLFRELALQPNPYMASYESVEKAMVDAMGGDENMRDWSVEQRKRLFLKLRVFQTGLSAMVATGNIPAWLDEQGAEELLLEVGEELFRLQQMKREEER